MNFCKLRALAYGFQPYRNWEVFGRFATWLRCYFVCSSANINSSIFRLNQGYFDCTTNTIFCVSNSNSFSQMLSILLLLPGDCWSRDTSRGAWNFYSLILNRCNSKWSSNHLCWYCKFENKRRY